MSGLGALAAGALVGIELVAIVVVGHRFAQWFEPEGDVWARALAGLVASLVFVVLVLTGLGVVGLFRPAPIVVAVVAGALVVWWRLPVARNDDGLERPGLDGPGADGPGPARPAGVLGLATACLAALVFGHYLAVGLSGTSSGTDTLKYHLPNLGGWLSDGSLWGLPFAAPGFTTNSYPSSFELTAALLMAPTGSDQLVFAAILPWAGLAVLASAVAARELGGTALVGALGGLAVLATPLVVWTHAGALSTDVAAAAGVVAAVALVLRVPASRFPVRAAVLAGLALGLATGSKYTAFAPAVAVLALVLVVTQRPRRLLTAAGLIGGAALVSGFWLVRNAAATGNPLFPLGLGPLTGAETPLERFETPLASHIAHGRGEALRTWASLARTFYGPVLVLPVAATAAVVLHGRRRWVAAVVAASLVAYAVTPYTGGGEEALALLVGSQLRYVLPAVLLSAALAPAVLGRLGVPVLGVAVAWSGWRLAGGFANRPDVDPRPASVLWALAVAVVAALARWAARRAGDRWAGTGAPVALVVGVVAAVAATGALLVQGGRDATAIEQLLAAERRPAGPVAVVSVSQIRPLQGRWFDIDLVGPHAGGAASEAPVLHADELDRQLLELDPAVVALDRNPGITVPAGWAPSPDWRLATTVGTTDLYVRTG